MKEKDKDKTKEEAKEVKQIEQQLCCPYATMFWQEIDGIVDNIDSYTEDKKQQKQDELEEVFSTIDSK